VVVDFGGGSLNRYRSMPGDLIARDVDRPSPFLLELLAIPPFTILGVVSTSPDSFLTGDASLSDSTTMISA